MEEEGEGQGRGRAKEGKGKEGEERGVLAPQLRSLDPPVDFDPCYYLKASLKAIPPIVTDVLTYHSVFCLSVSMCVVCHTRAPCYSCRTESDAIWQGHSRGSK